MSTQTVLDADLEKTEAYSPDRPTKLVYITTNIESFQRFHDYPRKYITRLDRLIPTSTSGTSSFELGNYIDSIVGYSRDLTKTAREVARSLENEKQAQTAVLVLNEINEQLSRQINISYLPNFSAIQSEDKSLLIEWIFPNLRLGLSIEPIIEDSSWFLVSNDVAGNINAYGKLFCKKVNLPIKWLISLITSNPRITT
ncbi:MAG: hypothetical protein AB1894_17100 [Chloroflexota bacterium]